MRRGAGGRVGSGWRGVRPRLDVRPPNPTRAPGTPSPLWPVGGFGSESARVPSSQLRPFRPPRAPYPPAGRPGRGLRPKGRRTRRRPQPPGSAASGAQPLATTCASLGLESCENPPGALVSHRTRVPLAGRLSGAEPRAPRRL